VSDYRAYFSHGALSDSTSSITHAECPMRCDRVERIAADMRSKALAVSGDSCDEDVADLVGVVRHEVVGR
jgi:hypothetical protein